MSDNYERDTVSSKCEAGVAKSSAWDHATRGTYVDQALPRWAFAMVTILALAIMLVPSIGMVWFRTDSTTENRELASAPELVGGDGSPNVEFLADCGAYFEDHFAFRNQLVSANAHARAALGCSSTDQVVVGSDGWLYYGGTLPDYLGQSRMSDRALRNVAHNLSLAQDYVEGLGARFLLAIAPDKNGLYPENMPYYYFASDEASNWERLVPLLESEGVDFVDLQRLFSGELEVRYLRTDSHWDNRGALLAADEMLLSLGREALPVDVSSADSREDFAGDLESMLYPCGAQLESNYYYSGINKNEGDYAKAGTHDLIWDFAEGAEWSVAASMTQTECAGGSGSLLMFRDSFGNALLPYFAASFERSTFSKLVPYNLPTAVRAGADVVIIERAERHLGYLAETPPIMASPVLGGERRPSIIGEGDGSATLEVSADGPYWVLRGSLELQAAEDGGDIVISVQSPGGEEVFYNPFWVSENAEEAIGEGADDMGYLTYLRTDSVDLRGAVVRVYGTHGADAVLFEEFEDVQPADAGE